MAIQQNIIHPVGACVTRPSSPLKGLALLGVVYLVWGSTYLGIRVAVADGGGFPPFALGAVRLGSAGLLMLGWAWATGRAVVPPAGELRHHMASGMLMWLGGNGLVVWALTRVSSGYAALLMGTMPIFASLLDAAIARRAPSRRAALGLMLGLGGIATLSAPELLGGSGAAAWSGLVALIAAALSWAVGSIHQRSHRSSLDPIVGAGWVLFFGGVGFAAVSLALREATPTPSVGALWALAYLIIVGCVVGFGCYVLALRALPADLVMTHAYVNPVVAVILGWWFLGESLGVTTWLGAGLVVLGVYQVFRGRRS